MWEAEDQGLGGWKGASDRGENLTKKGLVGEIERSGSKLDIRIPGTRWVGASKRSGSEQSGGVKVAERVIGERENLGTGDWEVIKIKNTLRNE